MLILIPPSEGKSSKNTTETKFDDTNFIFSKQVKEIVEILKDKKEEIEKIYGTSLEKSKDLQEKNLSVFSNTCSKAIERYTGVVYNQLDLNNYSEESKNYFNSKTQFIRFIILKVRRIVTHKITLCSCSMHSPKFLFRPPASGD